MKFTKVEVRDLIISSLVIAFLFSFINLTIKSYIISFLLVAPTFILHELAHKYVAEKKGCIARYVIWPTGVIASIIFSFLTFGRVVFAAVGAVTISSVVPSRVGYKYIHLGKEDIGKIAVAGPLTNFGLAIIGYILSPISPLFSFFAEINAVIGLFNLIPFPPLDGIKVFGWSWMVWTLMIITGTILVFLPPYIGILWSILISIALAIVTLILTHLKAPPRKLSETPLYLPP